MYEPFYEELNHRLQDMRTKGVYKQHRYLQSPMDAAVQMEERGEVLILCSNNYLGLANHPEVIRAGQEALQVYGAGTASVRFICGTYTVHRELEERIARFLGTEASLSYVSCWNANEGTIPALMGPEDIILSDALNHASLIDACRLAGKTQRQIYRHANMTDLASKLKDAQSYRYRLIVTDGVFSMEGDLAPLADIVALAKKYRAIILVDDSHGTGVVGETGRGTADYFGVAKEIDIITGTLGKTLGGAAGGFVASRQAVIDQLSQVSRPQLFSNALPATVAASASKAFEILECEPQRVKRLHGKVDFFRNCLKEMGFKPLMSASAIIPIIIGDTAAAIRASEALLEHGVFVIGFGYPVVPEGTARLRVQISDALNEETMDRALHAFAQVGQQLGLLTSTS